MAEQSSTTGLVVKTAPWVYTFIFDYHRMATACKLPFDYEAMRTIATLGMTTNIPGYVPNVLRKRP